MVAGWNAVGSRLPPVARNVTNAIRRLVAARAADPPPRMPLVPVAAAVIAGGFLGGSIVPGSVAAVAWWAAAVGGMLAWCGFMVAGRERDAGWWMLLSVAAAAAAWSAAGRGIFSRDDLAWRLDTRPRPVVIEGVAVESPRTLLRDGEAPRGMPMDAASEFTIDLKAVRLATAWKPAAGRASIVVDGASPDVLPGSRVRVYGRGVRPSPAHNPHEFDFRERARSLRCLSLVRCRTADCVEVLEEPRWYAPGLIVHRLREWGMRQLERSIAAGRLSLAQAILLGGRDTLPREESREFLATGTVHILSISGLHVGILAIAVAWILRRAAVPPGWQLTIVALATGVYMLLVRAEMPVVRATLVVWLACLGAFFGRRAVTLNSLAAAAILVFVWQPSELFRTGTQLSFLSTAVLVAAVGAVGHRGRADDPIERLIERSRGPLEKLWRRIAGWSAESFLVGLVVWVATAPIVASTFHLVSPVAIVLNVVVAPIVAVAMASGFLCLVFSAVSSAAGAFFGFFCDATLLAVQMCIGWAASLPNAYAWVAGPSGWWVAGWYGGMCLLAGTLSRAALARRGPWLGAAVAWSAVGLASILPGWFERGRFEAVVASLGHGCGVLVKTAGGGTLLYDAGRLGAAGAATRAVSGVLWGEGVRRIDWLVISHADTDHFNAIPELFERFSVGTLVVSREFAGSRSPEAVRLLGLVDDLGIPVKIVRSGDAFAIDPTCLVRVLHPAAREPAGSDNEASVVIAVESSGRRLLLSGDIEGEGLARLVARQPGRGDVLVAPHHGTLTSLPPILAAATQPKLVVVSGMGGAAWPTVRRAYADATGRTPARVVKTGDDGAIRILMAADRIGLERYTADGWRPERPLRAP